MTELLGLLNIVSWPGVVAAGIYTLSNCYRAWLASRRVSMRVGDIHIDAVTPEDALRILQACERFAEERAHARDRPIPRYRDKEADTVRLGSSRT